MALISINPTTQEDIKVWKEHSSREIMEILDHAQRAYFIWNQKDLQSRIDFLKPLSEILRDNAKEFAIIMAEEMGKPLSQGVAEIHKCALLCDYYYEHSGTILAKLSIETESSDSYVTFEPLGVILGIMPWNFPFWQVFRFCIPTLMVGNAIILKHASNVQGCAQAIVRIFEDAGLPKQVFQNVALTSKNMSQVIEHPIIQGISLTGSTEVGKRVGATAGRFIKKTVMELGGNDPYLIFKDANLNGAIKACVDGRILNSGQSCISPKRIIVDKHIYDAFIEGMVQLLNTKIMGDPMDDVDMGPVVSITARDQLHHQVVESIRLGAKLIEGGSIPEGEGAFYPMTILGNVKPGMPAFDEELFGPVFSIIIADDDTHAIELANQSQYGLGSAIFTSDDLKAKKIAEKEIQSGVCFINDFVKSDPRLPFGGIKESGLGREMAHLGLTEFANIKTVVVK